MTQTMRVSLPGFNALTDGTIDHYALYADNDNVLIKEERRGTMTVSNGNTGTVSHNLGYIPFYLVYAQTGAGTYRIANAFNPIGGGWKAYTGTANLLIRNSFGTAGTAVQYYVFYDSLI